MGTRGALDRYIPQVCSRPAGTHPRREATFSNYAANARLAGTRALKAARPLATRVLAIVVLIIDCGSYKHLPDSGTKYDEVSK